MAVESTRIPVVAGEGIRSEVHMKLATWLGAAILSMALSASADKLWVCNAGAGTVSVIDTEKNNRVVANIALGAGSAPVSVAIAPFGRLVCVTDAGRASVWVLSWSARAVVAEIPVSIIQPFGCAFTIDGRKLYVGNGDNGFTAGLISVVDPNHLREIRTINISSQGTTGLDVAITPVGGQRLYVACNGTSNVVGIDTRTDTLITSAGFPINLAAGVARPFAIALRPDNGFLYVCLDDPAAAASQLAVVDVPTLTPSFVPLGAGQRCLGIYCSPRFTKAYVTTAASVRVLNDLTNVFVSNVLRLPAGAIPVKPAVSGDGRLGLVTDQGNAGAFTFQAMADIQTSGVIATGATPFGCAIVPITQNAAINALLFHQQRGRSRRRGLF